MAHETDRPATSIEPGAAEYTPPEPELPAEEDWPAPESTTNESGEWVKPCGCAGGENEHSLTCPEVQRYL